MGFDIPLVHRRGRVLALDDHLGLRKTGLHIAMTEFHLFGDIARPHRGGLDPRGEQVVVKQWRIIAHCLANLDDMGKNLKLHIDERQRFSRHPLGGRRNRGNRMAIVQDLASGHHVV